MSATPSYKPLVWTPETIKNFWAYQARRSTPHFSYQASRILLKLIAKNLQRCRRVLDYGCGPGFLIDALLGRGLQVTGVEYAEQLVTLVSEKFKNIPGFEGVYQVAKAQDLGVFDAVFALEVIEHLYDPALNELLSNLQKLVKVGGLLILTTRNQENLATEEVYCPNCDHVFHRIQHVRSWSPAQVTALCATWGFEVERLICTDLGILSAHLLYRIKYRIKQWFRRAEYPNLICIARRKPA